MERILGIFCMFSAIIVPGLLTKQEDLDTIKKSLEQVIVERFIENTLKELYAEDGDKLENVERGDAVSTQSPAKRFDDLHARGTNSTSTTTTPPPPPPLPTNANAATIAATTKATTKAPITFSFCKKRWWWSWPLCKRSMDKGVSSFEKIRLLQRMLDEELE